MKKTNNGVKKYVLSVLREQKKQYGQYYKDIKGMDDNYYKKMRLSKAQIQFQLHESINVLIGIKNSPNIGCVDMGVEEINKMVKNLINLKLVLENEKEMVYCEKEY